VQVAPRVAGIEAGDWNWKGVRTFCRERFGVTLCRSSCLNSLHRLAFVVRRPKKRLLKADETKREAFVREYAVLRVVAQLTKATIFFVDEAHFYADADLRGTWVLKGEPALVDSTSPRYGEKASYYSAVCVETGEVEYLALEGNSSAETSVAFLRHLRARHAAPLIAIWDNAPAHGGDSVRAAGGQTPDDRTTTEDRSGAQHQGDQGVGAGSNASVDIDLGPLAHRGDDVDQGRGTGDGPIDLPTAVRGHPHGGCTGVETAHRIVSPEHALDHDGEIGESGEVLDGCVGPGRGLVCGVQSLAQPSHRHPASHNWRRRHLSV